MNGEFSWTFNSIRVYLRLVQVKWRNGKGGGAKNRRQKREKSDDSWHGWQLHHIIQNFIKSWKASSSSSKISINYNDPCVCSDSNLERTMQQCFHYVSHALHVRTYNVRLCLRIYCMKHTAPYWAHICSYTETRVYLLPVRYSPSHLNRFGIESIDDVHVQLHGIEWLNSEMSRNGVCVCLCVTLPDLFQASQLLGNASRMAGRNQMLHGEQTFRFHRFVLLTLHRCQEHRAERALANTSMDLKDPVHIWNLGPQIGNQSWNGNATIGRAHARQKQRAKKDKANELEKARFSHMFVRFESISPVNALFSFDGNDSDSTFFRQRNRFRFVTKK